MSREKLFFGIAGGAVAGFCAGTVLSVQDVLSQRYVFYAMYRLVLLALQQPLNSWTLTAMAAFGCAGAGFWACLQGVGLMLRFRGGALDDRRTERLQVLGAAAVLLVPLIIAATFFRQTDAARPWLASFAAAIVFWLCVLTFKPPATLVRMLNKAALGCLVLLLGVNVWCAAAGLRARPSSPNIVMIVVDCLRPDHLGCYGYLRSTSAVIDMVARDGTLYRRAYANAPWTKPSVATMFSSLYPNVHNVRNPSSVVPDGMLTVAEILKNAGYNTFFFNGGNTFLKPDFKFDQGFSDYCYQPHRTRTAVDVTHDFLTHAGGRAETPFFAYIHYMDAHAPYTKNPRNGLFVQRISDRFEPGNRESGFNRLRALTLQGRVSPGDKEYIVALYDGQIRFVDDNIGVIRFFLEKQQLLGNTVFIITSDHGEEFWEHDNFEHGHTLYNELLHVPLILSGPGIPRAEISRQVSLIDIAPTILDIAHVDAPHAGFQGASLLRFLDSKQQMPDLPVFATGVLYGPERYCLMQGGGKLIENTDDRSGKWTLVGSEPRAETEYYDLVTDGSERHALSLDAVKLRGFETALEAFKNRRPLFQADESVRVMDAELKDRLEALGYVQ